MVRSICGVLAGSRRGERRLRTGSRELLETGDRRLLSPKAPAHGLTLVACPLRGKGFGYTHFVIDKDNVAAPGTAERELLDEIDLARLPRHIAIIMDGNGRWAKQRGSPRVEGHRAGIASVREAVETCARLELDALTLYAFSVENWKRPRFEIVTLMSLLKEYLNRELANLLKNDIRFRVVGRMNELDASVQKELSEGARRRRPPAAG